jgi:hypothetical protein
MATKIKHLKLKIMHKDIYNDSPPHFWGTQRPTTKLGRLSHLPANGKGKISMFSTTRYSVPEGK